MEQVVQALGGMLLRALPTFLLVLFLYVFLKKVFFNPLEKVMHERHEATEGAMKAARERLAAADQKSGEYEQALKEARAEMYRSQERERQQTVEETGALVRAARAQAEERVRGARQELEAEVALAKKSLEGESGTLANAVAQAVLKAKAETAS